MTAFEHPDIDREFRKNLRGNFDFYINTVKMGQISAYTVFASHQVINTINQHIPIGQQNYLMDGTFKVAPIGFYQLLIIYIQFKNDVGLKKIVRVIVSECEHCLCEC